MRSPNFNIHAPARTRSAALAVASLLAGLLALLPPSRTWAQYLYLDSNGNGIHDPADRLRECTTRIDVWLNTANNRNGTPATCPLGGAMSLSHYEFVLQAVGGTVTWGPMSNLIPAFSQSLARDARDITDPVHYHNGAATTDVPAGTLAPGLYKVATLSATIATGSPRIDVISKHPNNGTGRTSFGSECVATPPNNHMNRHGATWSDVDGLAAAAAIENDPFPSGPGVAVFKLGDAVDVSVSVSDPDVDPIQTLTANLSELPVGHDAVFTVAGLNTPTASGTLIWHPTLSDAGLYEIPFTTTNCRSSGHVTTVYVLGTATDVEASETRLINFLAANQPNPFAPNTTIDYSLAKEGDVRIHVFSASGRVVRALVNARMPAGPNRTSWNGTDDAGRPMASGVYWCRLESGSFRMSRRMILLR